MDPGLKLTLVLVVLTLILLLVWSVARYNGFIRLHHLVQESWRQVHLGLKRRHEAISSLVANLHEYAAPDRQVFDAVTAACAQAAQPALSPAEQAGREDQLTQALGQLLIAAEAHPQLQGSETLQQLRTTLANIDTRLAAGRRFYNANVRNLNTKVDSFPSKIIANKFGFTHAEYFETTGSTQQVRPQTGDGHKNTVGHGNTGAKDTPADAGTQVPTAGADTPPAEDDLAGSVYVVSDDNITGG